MTPTRPATLAATLVAALTAALAAGCASLPPAPLPMYDGPAHERDADAVLVPLVAPIGRMVTRSVVASVGPLDSRTEVQPSRQPTMRVLSVDGREVPLSGVSELRVPPGRHRIVIQVRHEVLMPLSPLTDEHEVTVAVLLVAGHTYLPNASVYKDRAVGRLDDMGEHYPERCLPGRRTLQGGAADETAAQAEACAPRVNVEDAPGATATPAADRPAAAPAASAEHH